MSKNHSFGELAPWFALGLTVVGGLLRMLLLADKGMWLDETVSVWIANQPVGDLLSAVVVVDRNPPLYHLLLHYWMVPFGSAAFQVRLLSVLFGTATIPLIYLIGHRLSGPTVGLIAAVFLAFSPFNIYYAQETRMYTLLTFIVAGAIYALAYLLTDPCSAQPIGRQVASTIYSGLPRSPVVALKAVKTDLAWLAFTVFSVLALLTHTTAVLFPLATNGFVVGLWFWQKIRKAPSFSPLHVPSMRNWLIVQLLIFLLWSPWLGFFVQHTRQVVERFWIPQPTLYTFAQTVQALLNSSAQGRGFQYIVLGMLCAVLILSLIYYRNRLSIFFFLASLVAIPIAAELVVSIIRPIFLHRTLIWTTIPLLLLLAAGVAQLKNRVAISVCVALIAANYLFAVSDYLRFYQKQDWNSPARYVAELAQNGDLVLFNSNFMVIPFNYYFQPLADQSSLQVVERGIPLDIFETAVFEPTMAEADIPNQVSLINSYDRVWLVYSNAIYTDPQGLIPRTLAEHMKLTFEREFYGGKVQLYLRSDD